MYMSICWYLRVLPVLHRPEVVDIGVKSNIEKHAICLKDYRINEISTRIYPQMLHKSPCTYWILKNDLILQYFRHMACFSIFDLTPISTTSGLWSTGNTRKYQQIDAYIYQCDNTTTTKLRYNTSCHTIEAAKNNELMTTVPTPPNRQQL